MLLFGILLSLLLSALFSGTEIAFISASKLMVELKRKKGTRRGQILATFYNKPAEFIGTLLIGNNIALVAFTTLMTIPLSHFLSSVLGLNSDLAILVLNTLLITAVVLVFGEFLPKVFFRLYADTILYTLAYPLWLIRVFLILPAKFTTWISRFILKNLLKLEVEETQDVLTRLDLEAFIKSSSTEADDSIDTEMFEKALNLREVRVGECMVPRPEIVAIDVNASIQELIDLFQESNLSRILIYEEDIDNVLGYVHHQQLLKKPKSIQSIVLEIPYVPEAMRVRDLLSFFVKNRQTIACVVDEFGGTAGLVTLEDVLEEIFGEIEDEHDHEEYIEEVVGEGEYVFSGRLEIDYLNEKYPELQLPEGEYHTLSGYLVMTTQQIPKEGDEIVLGGVRFVLESVSNTKIEKVRVILPKEEEVPSQ